MTLDQTLRILYRNELNVQISCFWDSGWDVGLGDKINGFKATANFDTPEEVAAWLRMEAPKHYPELQFHPTHCPICGQKNDASAACAVGGCPIGGDL